MATTDAVWNEHDTTPDAIEAALRRLLAERHAENESFVPARVLNMITFVDDEWSGEIANRLRRVGNYNASRLLVLSYDPRRDSLDARVSIASDVDPEPGQLALLREIVVVRIAPAPGRPADDRRPARGHRPADTPLVSAWSPGGRRHAAGALAGDAARLGRGARLAGRHRPCLRALRAGLRRRPCVAAHDPVARADRRHLRPGGAAPELCQLESVTVRHHVDSTVAAMLVVAWLASRLGWEIESLHSRRPRPRRQCPRRAG